MRNLWAAALRILGGILALLSCLPMLAMLPAGFASALAFLGFTAPWLAAWAAPLAPIASPLLILSIVLLVIGNLRCGWQPAGLSAIGGLFVYLAMYVFVTPVAMNAMASPNASTPWMPGLTNEPMFYVGLILMAGSVGLVLWRQRQKTCRPFDPFAFLRRVP